MSDTLSFKCIRATQGQSQIFLSSLPFSQLRPLMVVSPREPREDDPYFSNDRSRSEQPPQRPENEERLKQIAKFVRARLEQTDVTRKSVVFPTTVILGLLVECEFHSSAPSGDEIRSIAHVFPDDAATWSMRLPNKAGTLFIIDGQHRLKGIGYLLDSLLGERAKLSAGIKNEELDSLIMRVESLEVPISFLVDFDLDEQSIVFSDVNFNQKPVSRSFYYDIFGAFESDRVSPLNFVHEFVVHLNNSGESPLKGMIKLLGTGPGFVSQAFMVERLLPLIDPQNPKSVFRTFYIRRVGGDLDASRLFSRLVKSYFGTVMDEFAYAWPHSDAAGFFDVRGYEFILAKSMVLSALLGVLRELYKLCLLDFARDREIELLRDGVFTPALWKLFFAGFDPDGQADPTKSIFHRKSEWAVGGSSKIERLIFLSLREKVLRNYQLIANAPESDYQALCSRLDGPKSGLQLAVAITDPSEFWNSIENDWIKTSEDR